MWSGLFDLDAAMRAPACLKQQFCCSSKKPRRGRLLAPLTAPLTWHLFFFVLAPFPFPVCIQHHSVPFRTAVHGLHKSLQARQVVQLNFLKASPRVLHFSVASSELQ